MIDYDAWLSKGSDYEKFIGADEDEDSEERDYCDEHEEEWKLEGKW